MIEAISRFSAGPEADASEHTALWIPGIQDVVGDREALCDLLSRRGLEIHHPDFHYNEFHISERKGRWMDYKTKEEVARINDQGYKILIAHSYGTHRTIEILRQCPRVQAVALLNAPKNAMSTYNRNDSKGQSSVDTSTPAESMLRPLALEMDDATFAAFLERHEQTYEHERHRIRTELKELREGPAFTDLLRQCRGDVQILLVQAPLDPWNIEEELSHTNMRTVALKNALHYPHISQPERLSLIISRWVKASLQSNRPAVAPIMPVDISVH